MKHGNLMTRTGLLVAALTGAAGPAAAQDFHLSAGFGGSRFNVVCDGAGPCDKGATGWRLAAGWQANPNWGAEALYLSAGDFKAAGNNVAGDAKASGYGLAGTYRLPLDKNIALLARLGVARMKGEFTPTTSGASGSSQTTTQPLVGLSLQYDFSQTLGARLDWDATRARMANDAGSLNLVSASLLLRF